MIYAVQYDSELKENDPRALVNELVPERVIQLQDAIQKKLADDQKKLMDDQKKQDYIPLLKREDFYESFKDHFDGNTVEMKEAVRFLGYQG